MSIRAVGVLSLLAVASGCMRFGFDPREDHIAPCTDGEGLAAFEMLGATLPGETAPDPWIVGPGDATFHWTPSVGAATYDIEVTPLDGTSIAPSCVFVALPGSVDHHTLEGCELAPDVAHAVRIYARDPGARACREAADSPYLVVRSTPRTLSLRVSADWDDGYLPHPAPATVVVDSGMVWTGEWDSGAAEFAYLRFRLGEPMEPGLHVSRAALSVTARGNSQWQPVDALRIFAERSPNALQVREPSREPTTFGSALSAGSVRWPATGPLAWPMGQRLRAPDLSALVQEVIDREGGIRAGGHIQLWMRADVIDGTRGDVEIHDWSEGAEEAASLDIEAVRDQPRGAHLHGLVGGPDRFADHRLLGGGRPALVFDAALGARFHEAEILEADGITPRCSPARVDYDARRIELAACALAASASYVARLHAIDSGGTRVEALNSPFSFVTGPGLDPVYPRHANWNDYAEADRTAIGPYAGRDRTCDTDSEGLPSRCAHGGERRRLATALSSCAGLTARDSLDVFAWRCDDRSGNAVLYSAHLREGRGLRHLVTAEGWAPLALDVRLSGQPYFTAAAGTWWQNPIRPAPPNVSGTRLFLTRAPVAPGTIFVAASDVATSSYGIAAHKTALVAVDGASITAATTTAVPPCLFADRCLIELSGSFAWVEGTFASGGPPAGATVGVALTAAQDCRLHDVAIDVADVGIMLAAARGVVIDGARLHAGGDGIRSTWGARFNLMTRVTTHSGGRGIYLAGDPAGAVSHHVISRLITAGHAGYGALQLENTGGADSNVISHSTIANNARAGLWVTTGSDDNTFHQMLFVNNQTGIYETGSSGNTFAQIAGGHHDTALSGTFVSMTTPGNPFVGHLLLGDNRVDCAIDPAAGGGETGCTRSGLDGSSDWPSGLHSAVVHPNLDLQNSFVGRVRSDTVNGTATLAATGKASAGAISDWLQFENRYRVVGIDDALPLMPLGQYGSCEIATSQTCELWDLRLHERDTELAFRSGGYPGGRQNQRFVANAPCPDAAHGDQAITDRRRVEVVGDGVGNDDGHCTAGEACEPPSTFLANAQEILLDGIGDDDALCESDEHCIYSPHIGAYQGEGDFLDQTCVFVDGIVRGVTLHAFPVAVAPDSARYQALRIRSPADDGFQEAGVHYPNGYLGEVYFGDSGGAPTWGYFRFLTVRPIAAGIRVAARFFAIAGASVGWSPAADSLMVFAEDAPDAPAVTSAGRVPSGSDQVPLTATGARWPPSGGLAFGRLTVVEVDLSPVIQELVDRYGGLAAGAAIQIWIRGAGVADTRLVAVPDFDSFPTRAARLLLEW